MGHKAGRVRQIMSQTAGSGIARSLKEWCAEGLMPLRDCTAPDCNSRINAMLWLRLVGLWVESPSEERLRRTGLQVVRG